MPRHGQRDTTSPNAPPHESPVFASGHARSVRPVPIRQSSTYESVVSTLSNSLGPLATTSTRSIGSWSRRLSGSFLPLNGGRAASSSTDTNASTAPDVDVQNDSGDEGVPPRITVHTSTQPQHDKPDEQLNRDNIVFSTWDTLPDGKKVLIQLSSDGGLRIRDTSNLQEFTEILRSSIVIGENDGSAVCARMMPRLPEGGTEWVAGETVLVILTDNNLLLLYSLCTYKVIKRIPFASRKPTGLAVSFSISSKFIVISHISPPSLSILSLLDFQETAISPLLDVASNPYTGEPVYALSTSSGGRMLAYSSTRPFAEEGNNGIIASSTSEHGKEYRSYSETGGGLETGGDPYIDSARRLGEGMMSGVKAISGYGYSKYMDYNNSSASSGSALSKSAPQSRGYLIRQAEERVAEDTGGRKSTSAFHTRDRTSNAQTSVVVIDLVASARAASISTAPSRTPSANASSILKIVAHFRPSMSHPTVLLSFSPNGTNLLTASSEGHAFHIFELRPSSVIGSSSVRLASSSSSSSSSSSYSAQSSPARSGQPIGKVWHCYRLNRGFTNAHAVSCTWSHDGRFVSVVTDKGTAHIYAINPQGGKVGWESHASETVRNERELAPLSVGLEAVARVRSPKIGFGELEERKQKQGGGQGEPMEDTMKHRPVLPPQIRFLPNGQVPQSFAYAAHSSSISAPSSSTTSPLSRELSIAFFYPHTEEVMLSTLVLSSSASSTGTLVGSAAPLAGKAATSAMSGLSKMMRQSTITQIQGGGKRLEVTKEDDLVVKHERRAYWSLGEANDSEKEAREVRAQLKETGIRGSSFHIGSTSAHHAEIVSFSPYPAVLPRSVYTSALFTCHIYPPRPPSFPQSQDHPIIAYFEKGDFVGLKDRFIKITVREEVSHRSLQEESSELHTAMHSILDTHASSSDPAGGSAEGNSEEAKENLASPPAYPNGFPRIRQSWTNSIASNLLLPKAIPIPIPVSRGMQNAARGALAGLRSPKLSSSTGGGGNEAKEERGRTTSLSFEDDDAVLATLPAPMHEEEPVDLFARHGSSLSSRSARTSRSLPAPPVAHSFAPSSHTPSSLGVIPELYLDNGSSAEDPREAGDDSPQTRASTSEDERPYRNDGREDEWDAWKLDGIDDEQPQVQIPEAKHEVAAQLAAQPTSLTHVLAPPILPIAVPTLKAAQTAPAVPEKPHNLLSPASSGIPSPAQPDLLVQTTSTTTNSTTTNSTTTNSTSTKTKKKKLKGKKSATPSPSLI